MGIVDREHDLGRLGILQKRVDRPAHEPRLRQPGRLHGRKHVCEAAEGQTRRGDRRGGGQHFELTPIEALDRLAEQAGLANPGYTTNDQAATGLTGHKVSEPGQLSGPPNESPGGVHPRSVQGP